MRFRRATRMALVAAILISASPLVAQQIPREPLSPGTLRTLQLPLQNGSRQIKTMFPRHPGAGLSPQISDNVLAAAALTAARARVVGTTAILLVNTSKAPFGVQLSRGDSWSTTTVPAFDASEIDCAECGKKLRLRFDDTKEVKIVEFDAGSRVAIVWMAANTRYQALPLALALSLFGGN